MGEDLIREAFWSEMNSKGYNVHTLRDNIDLKSVTFTFQGKSYEVEIDRRAENIVEFGKKLEYAAIDAVTKKQVVKRDVLLPEESKELSKRAYTATMIAQGLVTVRRYWDGDVMYWKDLVNDAYKIADGIIQKETNNHGTG